MTQVCRTCLEEVSKAVNYHELNGDERSVQITKQFKLCIPELYSHLEKDPVICLTCASMLHLFYIFKRKCLYAQAATHNEIEKSSRPVQLLLGDLVNKPRRSESNSPVAIKIEWNNIEDDESPFVSEESDDLENDVGDKIQDFANGMLETEVDIKCNNYMLIENEFQEIFEDSGNSPETHESVQERAPILDPEYNLQPSVQLVQLPDDIMPTETVIVNTSDMTNPLMIDDWEKIIKKKVSPVKTSQPKKKYLKSASNLPGKRASSLHHKKDDHDSPVLTGTVLPENTSAVLVQNKSLKKKNAISCKTKKYFACCLCSYASATSNDLREHLKVHGKGQLYRCCHCSFKTKYRNSFSRHLAVHLKTSILACNNCGFKTISIREYNIHSKKHLNQHVNINDDTENKPIEESLLEKPFECNICSYRGKTRGLLRNHIYRHFKKHQSKMSIINGSKFNIAQYMTINKIFKCDYCRFRTATKTSLDHHTKVHNKLQKVNTKTLCCKHCTYTTKNKNALLYHRKSHESAMPFGCIVCEYTSYHRKNFLVHIKRHTTATRTSTPSHNQLRRYDFDFVQHAKDKDGDVTQPTDDKSDYLTQPGA